MKPIVQLHRIWLFSPSERRQAKLSARYYDSDLSGTEAGEQQFYRARMHHSLFRNMKGRGVNFTGARIDHCDLSGADLAGANFFRSEIVQCVFCGADLQNCDFREARIRGGDFRGANLKGAIGLRVDQLAQAMTDPMTILP